MNLKGFYRTLIYSGLISLVLFTPFIHSKDIYNGIISAKQFWFYSAMALLMLAFGINLLFTRSVSTFRLNIIDISLIVFYLYFFIRALLTPYTPLIYNTKFLNYSLLLVFYFIVKSIVSNNALNIEVNSTVDIKKTGEVISSSEILVLVLISTGLIQAIWGLLQLYGITRSFHSGFKITGTFFNPAPYALYLAAIFPMALSRVLGMNKLELTNDNRMTGKVRMCLIRVVAEGKARKERVSYIINKVTYFIALLTIISIILVLPATMNRASWMGATIGSLVVFNYRYHLLDQAKSYLHSTSRKLFSFAIGVLVICLSTAGLYFLKKGSSKSRLLIWEVTISKIVEKPLFGQGVGRFEAEYNNWQAEYFKSHPSERGGAKGTVAGNTKYCFNEYLEISSQLGLIGLLLFLTVIASVFFGIKTKIMTTNDGHGPNDMRGANDVKQMTAQPNDNKNSLVPSFLNSLIILISSLISLLVCATISFPFYSLPTLIVFFLLLAIVSSHIKKITVSERLISSSILRSITRLPIRSTLSIISTLSTFLTLSTISVLLLFMTRQQYKAYYTWDEAEMLYQTGSYNEACKTFPEVYVPLQYTGSYLQYYGKALYLNEEYAKSITMLERAGKFGTDEILYCSLGDSYKASKMYNEAKEAYRYASFMVPHKLYPLYLLANLYEEIGQKEKALMTAEEVINKEIKVESTATNEIIRDMKELIRKLINK